MTDEKRIVEGYEITQAVSLGDREVVFGVNENAECPYLCAFYTDNELFGQYDECLAGDDYAEILDIFAERIHEQGEKFKAERNAVTVPKEKITADMCIPDDSDRCIEGKVVAVNPDVLRPEYRSQDVQLVLCTGGSGAQARSRGSACFCVNLYTGEHCRWERRSILGEIKELPEWAEKRLEAVRNQERISRRREDKEAR